MIQFFKKINQHFIQSATTTKLLFVKALFLSAFVRFIVLAIPFKKYKKMLGNPMRESTYETTLEEIKKAKEISCVVKTICKHTLWDSKCLVQSLTAKRLLKQQGISSTIYFGVQKTKTNSLKAHAWLRVGTDIVIGKETQPYFKMVNYYS